MWKIADIEISSPVILAPMAGITNLAYREFAKTFGVGLTYTEMVSDCGLIYKNAETYKYLETSKTERPVAIQLFGGTKETLLRGLKEIEEFNDNYDFLDINLGCPVVKVTKSGAGSAWLLREEELFLMMREVVKVSKKPVTVKIRIGWNHETINVHRVVELLERAGVALIAIHPRTRSQFYAGKSNYDMLIGLKDKMRIPLVISGDINTLDDAINFKEKTKADAVMVARGALGNPHLIKQISHYFLTGEKLPDATLEDNVNYMLRHAMMLIALKGEVIAIKEMRGIAPKYFAGFPHTKEIRAQLATKIITLEDIKTVLKEANLID